ncbi:hypothetical protein B0T20DRAFT_391298 [Sordaria brevicollis]|uniref:GH18 domain-containing protein n=1 Tax=Sordaria brevicollis TaxID=83679 RepID=A0AAE0PGZ8_SORBR|nr:hypothetical protein B0T20DRAFT_391298 [Sordaria brevicollis]
MLFTKAVALVAISFCSLLVSAAPALTSNHSTYRNNDLDTRAAATGYKNVVYFTNWGIYERKYNPSDLPVVNITHVLYAFANVTSNGTVYAIDEEANVIKYYPGDCAVWRRWAAPFLTAVRPL